MEEHIISAKFKYFVVLFCLVICLCLLAGQLSASLGEESYDLQVKKLYASPEVEAKVVYEIPLEVKLLDLTDDFNWYKVYIKFNIGPANFRYTGWAYIPIGNLMAEKSKAKLTAEKAPE
jgi:hypothetical protein